MIDVVLIYPKQIGLKEPTAYAPLGLLYIAANLIKNDISVSVINYADNESIPEANFYGIYTCNSSYRYVKEIVSYLMVDRPAGKIILGGPHCISFPEKVLKETGVDYVVDGEGEYATVSIVRNEVHEGIVFAKKIKDIDKLPFPARDIMPFYEVFNSTNIHRHSDSGIATSMVTMRGCPHICSFCSKIKTLKGYPSLHSPAYIVAEMMELKNKYGCTHIRIQDDLFNINVQRTLKICDMIEGEGFSFTFCTRGDTLQDMYVLRRMKQAGFDTIAIGVESADNGILRSVQKNETIEVIKQAFINCRSMGIRTHALLQFGLPGETLETIEKTKEFMKEIKPDTYILSSFTPLPDSDIWNNPDRYGILLNKESYSGWFYHEPEDNSDMPSYLPEEVKEERGELISYLRSEKWRE
jgi:anaerobic magnesium-protoporphyrin IX monomethyl ester cyclase